MTSPFHGVAEQYRAKGFSVVPLVARSKRVVIQNWSNYCSDLASNDVFSHWMTWPESNIGLCLGAASGVMALDYDADSDGLHARIQAIVPVSPCVKRGAKGFTAFYRYSGQRSAGLRHGGVTVLDVLSNGRQTVLPPSIHPDGMAYAWEGLGLLDVGVDGLPEITAGMLAEVTRLFRGEQKFEPVKFDSFDFGDDAEVEQALKYIRADDYHTWISIGMALKDKLGDAGYGLWDAWSSASAGYGGGVETRKKWQSFKGQGLSIATVFYEAINAGFKPEPRPAPEWARVEIVTGGSMEPGRVEAQVVKMDINAPGLPGLIAEHINATAGYKQPVLAMGAAIAAAGAIMGNRVKTETGLFSNIYTLGIAESGAGKDHARKVLKNLLLDCGLSHLEMGVPKSGAGLVSALHKRGGTALALIDEFGYLLGKLNGRNVQSHEREITSLLLELYSTAGAAFAGGEYANHDGKMPQKIIERPCLSMYPVTTPSRFYGSLTSLEILDGFIARFLVFETKEYPIEWQKTREIEDVPQSLRDAVQMWSSRGVEGNMPQVPVAAVVPFTAEAREILFGYQRMMREKAAEIIRTGGNEHPIYGRLPESAMKLALIAHEGDAICAKVAAWAVKTAEQCVEPFMVAVRSKVADNEHQRQSNEVLDFVRTRSTQKIPTSGSDIAMRFRKIDRRVRSGLIDDLLESGEMNHAIEGEGKKKKKIYFCD